MPRPYLSFAQEIDTITDVEHDTIHTLVIFDMLVKVFYASSIGVIGFVEDQAGVMHVVHYDQAILSDQGQDGLIIIDLVWLIGIDKDKVKISKMLFGLG